MKLYRSRSSYANTPQEAQQSPLPFYRSHSTYGQPQPAEISRRPTWRGFEDVTHRKRIIAALLICFVLFIGVAPVLLGRAGRTATDSEAVIRVIATLDGKPWSGLLEFKLSGSEQWLGSMVPCETRLPPGVYGIRVSGGGPHRGALKDIMPLGSRYVGAGETITLIVVYEGEGT